MVSCIIGISKAVTIIYIFTGKSHTITTNHFVQSDSYDGISKSVYCLVIYFFFSVMFVTCISFIIQGISSNM